MRRAAALPVVPLVALLASGVSAGSSAAPADDVASCVDALVARLVEAHRFSGAIRAEAAQDSAAPVRARRLLDRPIITPSLDPGPGPNIQGSSLIRVPDGVKGRLGRYYRPVA